jgi:hypothetical protein
MGLGDIYHKAHEDHEEIRGRHPALFSMSSMISMVMLYDLFPEIAYALDPLKVSILSPERCVMT